MKKIRCQWLNISNSLYVSYHDREWGRPVHDDRMHFELLTLEGAQAGLSWDTILNKRENYRKAFHQFDPKKVARMSQDDVERLMQDAGIVRHRLKIQSTLSNAREFLSIQKEFGSFDDYVWNFVGGKPLLHQRSTLQATLQATLQDYPTNSPESDALSKDLKRRGFRFVGSTIMYAYMQAAGLVNDHSTECFLYHGRHHGKTTEPTD